MKNHLHRSLAVVGALLGLLPAVARAQQATTISGRVTTDAQTPLPSVSVSIPSLGVGAMTDAEGRYTFTVAAARAPRTPVELSARRIGYQPKSVNVTLVGQPITQDFALAATATQ